MAAPIIPIISNGNPDPVSLPQQQQQQDSKPELQFNPDPTKYVVDAMGPGTSARSREVLSSLIRHLHDFAREVELTNDEWMMGLDYIKSVGQAAGPEGLDETRSVWTILGFESFVTETTRTHPGPNVLAPTSCAIEGPFWSPHAPSRPLGDSIAQDGVPPNGRVVLMHGVVRDSATGQGIPDAVVDVWQASTNGKYDVEEPAKQTPNNLRGKFRTDSAGRYWLYCLRPTEYAVPMDGPTGVLLRLMDRSNMRPAHIHAIVTHPAYGSVTTQLYPDGDPYLAHDVVCAVRPDLVVTFKPKEGDEKADLDLEYDFVLVPKQDGSGTKS